jgi:signal transduction histidine kinase
MRAMVSDAALLAIQSRRHVEFDAPPSAVFERGSPTAIEAVVANLIDNAVRAEAEGGTVIVRVAADATIAVTDHGEGVVETDHDRIFEPFWRKAETTRGAGLGLAITKEIVEAHGWRIWVEDTPGGGATFRLAFQNLRE